MKKRRMLLLAGALAAIVAAFGVSACGSDGSGGTYSSEVGWTPEAVYARALELGYEGTWEEFVAALDGEDGTGISDVFQEDGNLVVVLTDGRRIDCGGIEGNPGKDGRGIRSAQIDEDGNLIVIFDDGETVNCGKVTGKDGEKGSPGTGVEDVFFNENGEIVVLLTDGNSVNCGRPPVCRHAYPDWTAGAAATCTSMGYKMRTCGLCGNTEYEFEQPLGHRYGEWRDMISTCTSRWQVRTCSVCGDTQTAEAEPVGHHYVDDVCTVCGELLDWDTFDFSFLDAYNGTYGYEFLGTMEDGEALQGLYEAIDKEVRLFHVNTGLDAGEDLVVSEVDYAQFGIGTDEAASVWKTYKDDNPLYYWLANRLTVTSEKLILLTEEEYADGEDRAVLNESVYGGAEAFAALLEEGETDYRTALAGHDFIIEAVDYAYTADGLPETAARAHNVIGVFEGTGAVCEGYARTFQLLLNYSGVENVFVTGKTDEGEAHAWNLVRLDDGDWYWCDLTWDDRADSWKWGVVYNYFCVTDTTNTLWSEGGWVYDRTETFLDTHIWDTSDRTGVEFLYDLPARATGEFSDGTQLILGDRFETENCSFTVAGYNAVELNRIGGSGSVRIPETVNFGGVPYTVVSVGFGGKAGWVPESGITSVYIPESVKFIWDGVFGQSTLENIFVDERNPKFRSEDGVLFSKSLYTLIAYPGANARTEYAIPEQTVKITYKAFGDCGNLETLVVGENVSAVWVANWGSGYADSEGGNQITGGWSSIVGGMALNGRVIVSENNDRFCSDGSAIYNRSKTIVLAGFRDLFSYTVPETVRQIEDGAFEGSPKLIEIYNCSPLPVAAGDRGYGSVALVAKNVYTPASGESRLTERDGYVFYDDGGEYLLVGYVGTDTRLVLPKDIDGRKYSVYEYAFSGLSGIESVFVSDGAASLGERSFAYCVNLKEFTIGDGITEIPSRLLTGCDNLESISLGRDVKTLNRECFSLLPKLESIYYNCVACDDLDDWGSDAFRGSGNSSAGIVLTIGKDAEYIPANLFNWESSSFSKRVNLVEVIFEEGSKCTEIGRRAFYYAYLTSITLPESLEKIGEDAFYGCTMLSEVYNYSSLPIAAGDSGNGFVGYYARNVYTGPEESRLETTADGYVFYRDEEGGYCLIAYRGESTDLVLPGDIRGQNYRIDSYAFFKSNLRSVVIPDGVTAIGDYAFSESEDLRSITIGGGVKSIGVRVLSECESLESIVVAETNKVYGGAGNCLTEKATKTLIAGCRTSVIPTDGSVTAIKENAFYGCTLTHIVIPASVVSIGTDAFMLCRELESIVVEEGNPVYFSSGNCVIAKADGVLVLGCAASVIPTDGSVKAIGAYAFQGQTGMREIIIPKSVTKIGNGAFWLCNLTVYFEGTREEWDAVEIGNYTGISEESVCFYSETEPEEDAEGRYWHYGADGATPVVWEKREQA